MTGPPRDRSRNDERWMDRALRLAERGSNTTHPNPRVGCVLVSEDTVVGEGWHRRAGAPHAEAEALAVASERARGATAYVNLEPCCHTGRTGPCADALIGAGVSAVVCANHDPDPRVAGGGIARLRAAGIEVRDGVLADRGRVLNAGFFSRIERGRPWVRIKLAASLDGRTALENGHSQWITGPAAREDVQRWRARAHVIMTGSGTVHRDDPQLDVRVDTERPSIRLLVGRSALPGPGARVWQGRGPVWLATAPMTTLDDQSRSRLDRVLRVGSHDCGLDLTALLGELAALEINEVHVEAGERLCGALLAAGLVDELVLYQAPCLIGRGRGLFAAPTLESMAERINLEVHSLDWFDADLRLVARVV